MGLNTHFLVIGYNVPTRVAPTFLLKITSWFDPTVKMIIPVLNKEVRLDNKKVTFSTCNLKGVLERYLTTVFTVNPLS